MKTKITACILVVVALMTLSGCRSQKEVNPMVGAVTTAPVGMAYSSDGTLTLRAWGKGATKEAAVENAMKEALSELLFNGIKSGPGAEMFRYPLLTDVNARERFSSYFEPFFSDGGEYTKFVREYSANSQLLKTGGGNLKGYGVVIVIDVSALKKQLRTDGLID